MARAVARLIARSVDDGSNDIEILVLRHQLKVPRVYLKTLYVLFFIGIGTRRCSDHIAGSIGFPRTRLSSTHGQLAPKTSIGETFSAALFTSTPRRRMMETEFRTPTATSALRTLGVMWGYQKVDGGES